MPSKREQILQRLEEVMSEEYIQAQTVVRNRALRREDDRPSISILDGDERARLTGDTGGRGPTGRPIGLPQLMTMTPQVFFIPKELLPTNQTIGVSPENIGSIVNSYADIIVRTVIQDAVLQSLVGSNGSITLTLVETDLKSGGALQGQCRLDFAFTYLMDPSEPLS